MLSPTTNLIGKGIYSLSEAHRITGVPIGNIIRWTRGYDFQSNETIRHMPLIIGSFQEGINKPILEFLDLLEIRFLNAFRDHGVSWKFIRIASQRAKELINHTHPFSTKIFKTDGKRIFAQIFNETKERILIDLVAYQYEFDKIVSPYLYGGIEFNNANEPTKWYPFPRKKTIVIDPLRGFGAPITNNSGIQTHVLAQCYSAMKSFECVANWYETDVESVKDSVLYERRHAA